MSSDDDEAVLQKHRDRLGTGLVRPLFKGGSGDIGSRRQSRESQNQSQAQAGIRQSKNPQPPRKPEATAPTDDDSDNDISVLGRHTNKLVLSKVGMLFPCLVWCLPCRHLDLSQRCRLLRDQLHCRPAKTLLPGPAASLAILAQHSKQLRVTAMRGLLAGACSRQRLAVQACVASDNNQFPGQKPGLRQHQKRLLPVTAMMICYMLHVRSSLNSSQASSVVQPVLWLLTEPLAEAYPRPQESQDRERQGQACPVPSKGQPARAAPLVAGQCLRASSLRPVCSAQRHQPVAAWLQGRKAQPKARHLPSQMVTVMRSTGLAYQQELLGPGHRFRWAWSLSPVHNLNRCVKDRLEPALLC